MSRLLTPLSPVTVLASAAVGGYEEARGPYGGALDLTSQDDLFGAATFELAEAEMARRALSLALGRCGREERTLGLLLAGDLQNQCVASSQGPAAGGTPFLGHFGACSTMVEG